MGQHYVTSRMEELLDVMPPMNLKLPDDSRPNLITDPT